MEHDIVKLHKRQFRRLNKAIPVRFQLAGKETADKRKECALIANNISEGGFSVEVTELEKGLFNIGSRQYIMNAAIDLPGYTKEITTIAKPIWSKESPSIKKHIIGMKFVEIVDIDRKKLSSYISDELNMLKPSPAIKNTEMQEVGLFKKVPFLSNLLELIRAMKFVNLPLLVKMKKAKKLADQMQWGHFTTKAVTALLNVGFFDEFSTNRFVDINTFSKKKNVDKRLLRLLCDYLYAVKVFKKHDSEYSLTSKGILINDMMRGLFDIIYAFDDIIYNIEPLLKKEKIIYQNVSRRLDREARGSSALAEFLPYPIVKDIIVKRGFKRVLDIGCGVGAFLIELCRTLPDVTTYGIDVSYDVLLHAQEQLKKYNLENRISLFEGDVTKDIEELAGRLDGVDVITAFFLLHELFFEQKEKLIEILSIIRSKFKDKPVIVCENIKLELEELKKDPGLYSELQLLHGFSCEQQLTRKEWKEVFAKAGFRVLEERYLSFTKVGIYILA